MGIFALDLTKYWPSPKISKPWSGRVETVQIAHSHESAERSSDILKAEGVANFRSAETAAFLHWQHIELLNLD
jgi:hypothetical protein